MGIKEWGYEYRNLMQQEINSYIHPFKKRGFMNHLLWLGIIIVTLLTVSCQINLGDSGGDPGIGGPYQTQILKVLVQPDTIARGDTTRITCVIKDSLDKRFIFVWQLQYGRPINAKDTIWAPKVDLKAYTTGHQNYIDWVAPTDTAGFFGFGVRADNKEKYSLPAESGSAIIVK